jgi:hypothetical protein
MIGWPLKPFLPVIKICHLRNGIRRLAGKAEQCSKIQHIPVYPNAAGQDASALEM